MTRNYYLLCLLALPYGLGAGSVDSALNNYVALHYSSRVMSWLHCMWGLGASVGPAIMGAALTGGFGWSAGYRWTGFIQVALTAVLIFSLPLWKKRPDLAAAEASAEKPAAMPLGKVLRIPGASGIMLTFLCYCALESTAGLWASSYLVLNRGIDEETAARFASLFYLGITVGRGLNGFIANKFSDKTLVRAGQVLLTAGILCILLPLGDTLALAGLVVVGLGCAPIYPCLIHATPGYFGADKSQALIGVQMASAYVGSCLTPPVYGFLADLIGPWLFPVFILLIAGVMFLMHEKLLRDVGA